MTNEELIKLAIDARKQATTPTGYYVGAAIITESNKVFTGCNLGSNDNLFNICAERASIVKMLTECKEKITRIAIVGGVQDNLSKTMPCGICRQLIYELNSETEVICGYLKDKELVYESYKISELLPSSFNF